MVYAGVISFEEIKYVGRKSPYILQDPIHTHAIYVHGYPLVKMPSLSSLLGLLAIRLIMQRLTVAQSFTFYTALLCTVSNFRFVTSIY